MKKIMCASVCALMLMCSAAFAADSITNANGAVWYVSSEVGKNNNDGKSPQTPFKNIQKAINSAKDGDIVKIAQGNYFGLMNAGNIKLTKALTLEGGYAKDFSARDILAHQSKVQPTNKSNKSGGNNPLLRIEAKQGNVIIDGLLFDKGESNNYHQRDGLVEGLGGMLLHPPLKSSNSSIPNAKMPLISGPSAGSFKGNLLIQNCLFLNGNNMGINIQSDGKSIIKNCVFVANSLFAVEMRGGSPTQRGHLEFAYNTVLFTWTRTKEMSDMGFGFRARAQMDYSIHNNIFALNSWSGVDTTHNDAKRKINLDNNMFLLNKKGDLLITYEGTLFPVNVADFGDVELESIQGNVAPQDMSALSKVLNQTYVAAFLNASYKEEITGDPNSSANQLRSMLGQNKEVSVKSSTSMYANKYPYADALKIFGAVPEYGAQIPK